MKKVIIDIPENKSSTYGKILDNRQISKLWKRVKDINHIFFESDRTNHIFFGNNEFMSLLYGGTGVINPQSNSNTSAMGIFALNNKNDNFEHTDDIQNITPIEINSDISSLMNISKEDVES